MIFINTFRRLMPNKGGKAKFQETWLRLPQFKDWLKKTPNVDNAHCLLCKKDFDVSNMGIAALHSHSKGKKHTEHASLSQTCQRLTFNVDHDHAKRTSTVNSNLTPYLVSNDVLNAEILWCLNVVSNNFSFRSSDNVTQLFQKMFPDSDVAKSFSIGRSKIAYSITHGLAPYFSETLLKYIAQSPAYVICFDESLNKVTQECQMDLHVRYFDINTDKVVTRYLSSSSLGHATAKQLRENFDHHLLKLSPAKLLQISMDGPNVNKKFYKDFCNDITENNINSGVLLDIGTCVLHSVHNSYKGAIVSTEFNIDSILTSLWWVFHDSPARRQDYKSLNPGASFPLKFCSHRWVENVNVIERAISIWDNISAYIKSFEEKKVKPKSASFKTVERAVNNPLTVPQFQYALLLARNVSPFLEEFQSDAPMAPFMADKLREMLLSLMGRLLTPTALQRISDDWKVMLSIDVSNLINQRHLDNIDCGFAVKTALSKVETSLQPSKLLEFQAACRTGFVQLLRKLISKSPLHHSLLDSLSSLSPQSILRDKEGSEKKFNSLLSTLVETKRFSPGVCDSAMDEYRFMLLTESSRLESFSLNKDRLDQFYMDLIGKSEKFSSLFSVIKLLLILSHGQASVERGFSVNKAMLRDNLQTETIIAMRQVLLHIIFYNFICQCLCLGSRRHMF